MIITGQVPTILHQHHPPPPCRVLLFFFHFLDFYQASSWWSTSESRRRITSRVVSSSPSSSQITDTTVPNLITPFLMVLKGTKNVDRTHKAKALFAYVDLKVWENPTWRYHTHQSKGKRGTKCKPLQPNGIRDRDRDRGSWVRSCRCVVVGC